MHSLVLVMLVFDALAVSFFQNAMLPGFSEVRWAHWLVTLVPLNTVTTYYGLSSGALSSVLLLGAVCFIE
jgi:hypothetical protein